MPVVKFDDIQVGVVYVTRGGLATIEEGADLVGWGYERVKVVDKNGVKMVVETPWKTLCALSMDYPLSSTQEDVVHAEFELLTTYVSKEEIPFDDAVTQGISVAGVKEDVEIPENLDDALIMICKVPHSIADLARKLEKTYQQVRYAIDRIALKRKYSVIRSTCNGHKTVQITEVK